LQGNAGQVPDARRSLAEVRSQAEPGNEDRSVGTRKQICHPGASLLKLLHRRALVPPTIEVPSPYEALMRFAAWMRALVFVVCLLPIACGAKAEKGKETKKPTEPEPEVKTEDVIVGKGSPVEKGDFVEVHYTGSLTDGTQFDSSVESQEPLSFRVGYGQMIRGF